MSHKRCTGFSLMEVLVSVTLLGLVSAAVWPALNQQQRVNYQMERRTAAIQAAQQVLDNLRIVDPTTMPTLGNSTVQEIVIGTYTFQVTSFFCSDMTFCISANTRHIEVVVNHNGQDIYDVQTVYTKLR